MKNIPIKAQVECSDGSCGKSTQVILNPVNHKVTHLVVEDRHLPDSHTRLVPVGQVASVTQEKITLNCTKAEVEKMPSFIVTNFVQESPSGKAYQSRDAYTYEYVVNDTGYDEFKEKNIPDGELALYPGMHIKSKDDDKVGKLDQLVLDPESGDITHLLMREGHLWGKKEVAIPVSEVEFCEADTINLKLDKAAVKALPAIAFKKP